MLRLWLWLCVAIFTVWTSSLSWKVAGYGGDLCPKLGGFRRVATIEEADLKVVVPNISTESLRLFVNCSDPENVQGLCITIFEMALSILTPAITPNNISIHYTCFNFTNVTTYDHLIQSVSNSTYDVAVGDITIGAQRSSMVDFTQKYIESGIVILNKLNKTKEISTFELFGYPFTKALWGSIIAAFVLTGVLLCLTEYDQNQAKLRGRSLFEQVDIIFWFLLETLILMKRENIRSTVGHVVMVAWVFFVLVLGVTYTGGLTSFLTTNSISTSELDLNTIKSSGITIGYRKGSIVKDYLITRFQISQDKLIPIRSISNFIGNMTLGLVIVDELPYVNNLLSRTQVCDFSVSSSPFTNEGFGFGFRKQLNFESRFSMAILNLTENGCLGDLQKEFNMTSTSICSSQQSQASTIPFNSSHLLFFPLMVTSFTCMILYIYKRTRHKEKKEKIEEDETLLRSHDSYIPHSYESTVILRSHDPYIPPRTRDLDTYL